MVIRCATDQNLPLCRQRRHGAVPGGIEQRYPQVYSPNLGKSFAHSWAIAKQIARILGRRGFRPMKFPYLRLKPFAGCARYCQDSYT